MNIHPTAEVLGTIGDLVTFIGAIVLATREAGEAKRTQHAIAIGETLAKYPSLQTLGVEIEGILIRKEGDVELAIASKSSKRARVGAILIAVGFLFLLGARGVELFGTEREKPSLQSSRSEERQLNQDVDGK